MFYKIPVKQIILEHKPRFHPASR